MTATGHTNWMRNYAAMGLSKLEGVVAELRDENGDAYERVLAHGADPAAHLEVAEQALQHKSAA